MTKPQDPLLSGGLNSDGITDEWSSGGESSLFILREGDRKYDLEERTAKFGEAVIRFLKKVPENAVNYRLISQLVGCSTSLGANYCEADEAVSRKEFCLKISTCRKEARETKFFLRMIATAEEKYREEARALWREANELHLIFCSIHRNSKGTSYK